MSCFARLPALLPVLTGALCLTLAACAVTPAPPALREAPFRIEEIYGHRPVIDAGLNGHAFRLMVHANAGSYLQVNHAQASQIGVTDLVHKGAYGISAPGQVSDLGRDDGRLAKFTVAGVTTPDVPIAVFEKPGENIVGMAGLPFLHGQRAIVDYARNVLILPRDAAESAAYGARLKGLGYTPHAMRRDAADGRYLVTVTVGRASRDFVVSTVAGVDIDTGFAEEAGIAAGPASGRFGGPTGKVGETRETAAPITLTIGGWTSQPLTATILDTYAYDDRTRPADPRGGTLGASFLIAHAAIADFGAGLLYLKQASAP